MSGQTVSNFQTVQGGQKRILLPDTSGSPLIGQTEQPHSGDMRSRRPVGFTLFVSETDRSFPGSEPIFNFSQNVGLSEFSRKCAISDDRSKLSAIHFEFKFNSNKND
ncbi:hypothetical protein L596_017110 [Steinernema carpocapsae]|uniref:Uncharacterized protein n=1 Tax=Steinernema carpocapsae TaxID=34508 RepID=A0A4U5N0J3_STECR|nr:hypothetical protein L596_017110 [Steinernema carpocapsae]